MKLASKQHFSPWEPVCVPPESIITAQIHVKLTLTPIVLAKVLQQPILGPIGFWKKWEKIMKMVILRKISILELPEIKEDG